MPESYIKNRLTKGRKIKHHLRLRARVIQKIMARARRFGGGKSGHPPQRRLRAAPLQEWRYKISVRPCTQQMTLHRVGVVMERRGSSNRQRGAGRLRVLRMTLITSRRCSKAQGQHRLRPTPRGAARRREAAPGHYLQLASGRALSACVGHLGAAELRPGPRNNRGRVRSGPVVSSIKHGVLERRILRCFC